MIKAIFIFINLSLWSLLSAEALKKESLEDYNKRMEWYVEAQYGLFMHFGLYSSLGGEWKGQVMGAKGVGGYSEWIQGILAIPKEEYAPLVKSFNPEGFDAEKIVSSAKAAGMKYVVITTKHHEGFCLWDSKYTDYDLGSTPIKDRDLLQELKDACDKHGLKLGLYYSIIDWHHPSQEPASMNREGHARNTLIKGREQEYFDYQRNQVLELIERYDPAILWFDGDWALWWTIEEGVKLYNAIREASPTVITNNRVAKRKNFDLDYVTQEQKHFDDVFPKHWEGCYTMNKSWGYKKSDSNWKTPEVVYQKMKDINSKGGNFLLNAGPDGNGVIQEEAYTIMSETKKLLEASPIEKVIPKIEQVPGILERVRKKGKKVNISGE